MAIGFQISAKLVANLAINGNLWILIIDAYYVFESLFLTTSLVWPTCVLFLH